MYELICGEVAGVTQERKFNPDDIQLPTGYHIELFAKGLTAPINMVFTRDWDILVADAGVLDGNGKVMKYTGEDFVVIADGFTPPLKCGMGSRFYGRTPSDDAAISPGRETATVVLTCKASDASPGTVCGVSSPLGGDGL
jgi:hypothetical protein